MRNLYRFISTYQLTFIWILLLSYISFAQNSGIIKIVAQGEPTSLGGTFRTLSFADFNDNEDILFVSEIAPFKYGSFIASIDTNTNVIIDSQFVDGLGMITRSSAASINNNGSIAFSAQIVNGDSKRDGLFLKTAEGTITPVVYNDDPIDGGNIGTPSLRPYSLNNNGAVAFAGYIIPEPFRQAIFINSGGTVSKVVATGEATPIGGTFKFAFMNMLDFNDAGTVLFGSDIEGGSSPEGIFTASGGVITKIVARGDPSLDGKQFTYLDPASINNLGDIIFEASVGIDFGTDYDGLFLYSGGVITQIARTGDAAPGGGTFGTFSYPEINDSKQVVFAASIDGGSSTYGIFYVTDGVIGKIVTNGEATPLGGSFSSADYPKLNAGGSVVFNSFVEGGSAASAIFLWNGGPRVEVSRDTVEFTDVVPGQTARLDMEVSNTGGKPLEVQEITVSPSPPFGLENVPAMPFSIEPGQKSQFLVTYSSPSNNSTNLEKTSEILTSVLIIRTNAPNSPTTIPIITPTPLYMIPSGVAYDPLNPYLEGGGAFHSKFTNLRINGSNLELVNQVIFEPSDHIEVTRINTTPSRVEFDMIVYHDAVLGERDLILRTSDGKEFKVTQTSGKKFIISKITTQFNQAVDQAAVNTLEYRDKLVANKKGVIRIQFQDPNQYGHKFNGRVVVSGIGTIPASAGTILIPQESYPEADIMNGRDYLTMPMQNPLTAGKQEFKVLLNRISDGRSIDGPIINRDVIESLDLNILAYSFRIRKGDGTILDPVPDANANSALDHLKLVYPVSENKVNFQHIKTRDLPSRYETKDATLTNGTSVTILTKKGKDDLFAALSKKLEVENKKLLAENKPLYTLIVTFLPDHILDVDNDNDGRVDGQILGSTSAGFKVCVIGLQNPLNLRSTLSHEIGHAIGTSLHPDPDFDDIDKYNNLGDEYEGGSFHCEVNPPVQGLSGFENSNCPNSPFVRDIHGDNIGTFSDMSAFNPLTMRPMLTYKGTAQTVINYNFMSSGIGTERSWVQPSTYSQLFTSLIPITGSRRNVIAKNAASNAIQLRGIIYNNDAVTFDDFNILFTDSRTHQLGGQYMFELQDASGNVLTSHSFDLDFIEISEPPRKSESDFFNITMDFPEGTKNIVLKKNGIQIASRTVSDNAPVVQITSPQSSGNFSGNVEINWTANDPDGDPLRYTILYAPDNETWLPVETNLSETSYIWDSNLFPGGTSAKLAVIASDGINSGEAETSVGFSIDKKLPSVEFTLPLTDTTYDGLSPVIFAASGYDPEDGILDPASYTFTSSIDGQLGTGSPFYVDQLSAGEHIIYVSVQDSDGNIALDSVSIIAQIPVSVKDDKVNSLVPDEYKLYQNYPNPFNPSTNIQFDLPEVSHVTIKIYDIQGQEITTLVDRMYMAGQHTVVWNGNGDRAGALSSGVYLIQMRANDFMIVRKAVLLR